MATAQLIDAKKVGKSSDHLKCRFQQNGHVIDGIGFNLADKLSHLNHAETHIAFTYQNDFNGRLTPQLELIDITYMSIKLLLGLCSYMTDDDIASIKRAHAFADHYHDLQIRKSGEPFITHTEHVAMILAQLNQQAETVQAGLLHDVLEDTSCTESDLQKEFGDHVLQMVNGVTKLERINFPSNIDLQAENYRKPLAMAKDIRIIVIKLADRLHKCAHCTSCHLKSNSELLKKRLKFCAAIASVGYGAY